MARPHKERPHITSILCSSTEYWGKPTVRNFRGGGGDVGIIRSPVRAIALPDKPGGWSGLLDGIALIVITYIPASVSRKEP